VNRATDRSTMVRPDRIRMQGIGPPAHLYGCEAQQSGCARGKSGGTVAFRAELVDFAAFYERTYPVAYRTALAICGEPALAADATQDAYLSAYREREHFRGEAPAGAWLHRIVVRAAIAGLRHRRVTWIGPAEPPRGDDQPWIAPDAVAPLDLRRALDVLTPTQRAAVVLRYYHDLDYADIASILDTSPGNVGSLLSRALDRLRTELNDKDELPALAGAVAGAGEAGHGR
jgi:RNA polymerase sigma-70 factor, ECF subfamily